MTWPLPPDFQPINLISIENQIATLVRDFQSTWQDFFCEEELHAHFYHRCKDVFPRYRTHDGIEVASFHYHFETFWRYPEGDLFAERCPALGHYASFDFVVLRDNFIADSRHRIVMNRYALGKKIVRNYPATDLQTRDQAIHVGVEMKLVIQGARGTVDSGDINRLEDRMLDAARKLAAEGIQRSFIIGLSQGPAPELSRAQAIIAGCLQLYLARFPDGNLSVVVATPQQTVLGGEWSDQAEFPNVVAQGGWPITRNP